MRRYLLAPALLVLAACQPADNAPQTEPAVAPESAVAKPAESGPTVDQVKAAIAGRASSAFQRRPLDKGLPDGVKLAINYHRLFENKIDGSTTSEYRALVEIFDPTAAIESALDQEFTARGFAVSDKSDVDGKRVLVYTRTYGPTVTIRIGAFNPGALPQAPGAVGTLHLT